MTDADCKKASISKSVWTASPFWACGNRSNPRWIVAGSPCYSSPHWAGPWTTRTAECWSHSLGIWAVPHRASWSFWGWTRSAPPGSSVRTAAIPRVGSKCFHRENCWRHWCGPVPVGAIGWSHDSCRTRRTLSSRWVCVYETVTSSWWIVRCWFYDMISSAVDQEKNSRASALVRACHMTTASYSEVLVDSHRIPLHTMMMRTWCLPLGHENSFVVVSAAHSSWSSHHHILLVYNTRDDKESHQWKAPLRKMRSLLWACCSTRLRWCRALEHLEPHRLQSVVEEQRFPPTWKVVRATWMRWWQQWLGPRRCYRLTRTAPATECIAPAQLSREGVVQAATQRSIPMVIRYHAFTQCHKLEHRIDHNWPSEWACLWTLWSSWYIRAWINRSDSCCCCCY